MKEKNKKGQHLNICNHHVYLRLLLCHEQKKRGEYQHSSHDQLRKVPLAILTGEEAGIRDKANIKSPSPPAVKQSLPISGSLLEEKQEKEQGGLQGQVLCLQRVDWLQLWFPIYLDGGN